MNLKHFLYSSYWFSQPDLATKGVEAVYLVILLALVLGGIAALIIRRRSVMPAMQNLLNRYAACGITMGIVGLLLFYFREQHVFFLGWRIWFLLWIIILASWLYRLVSYHLKRIPFIKAAYEERVAREKYLPKSK